MSFTPFMDNLKKALIETRGVTESTANKYLSDLIILNNKAHFKNLGFLRHFDVIESRISPYADTTKRNLLSSIVSVLSLYKDNKSFKKVLQYYDGRLKGEVSRSRETEKTNQGKLTERQKVNWIDWPEVIDMYKSLFEKAGKPVKSAGTQKINDWLRLITLAMFTLIPPRRNKDIAELMIVPEYKDTLPRGNYLDLKNWKLLFQNYKTAGTYNTQEVDISDNTELKELITNWLKIHPLWTKAKKDPIPFLVFADGRPLSTPVNALTRVLNYIFGRNVGSSMLRHAFHSHKYGAVIKEMEKDAADMGHSVSEVISTYIKHPDDTTDTGKNIRT